MNAKEINRLRDNEIERLNYRDSRKMQNDFNDLSLKLQLPNIFSVNSSYVQNGLSYDFRGKFVFKEDGRVIGNLNPKLIIDENLAFGIYDNESLNFLILRSRIKLDFVCGLVYSLKLDTQNKNSLIYQGKCAVIDYTFRLDKLLSLSWPGNKLAFDLQSKLFDEYKKEDISTYFQKNMHDEILNNGMEAKFILNLN